MYKTMSVIADGLWRMSDVLDRLRRWIRFVAGQASDLLLQLCLGPEFRTVQPRDPFLHQARHELLVLFKLVVHRRLLLRDVGEIDLAGHVTIRTPDAAIFGVLQRRAPVRVRIEILWLAIKRFNELMHE